MAQDGAEKNGSSDIKGSVLLIGSGGIGCEVLKNLVLCGVQSITVIDLDTIEVSNLNRQFLFRREHVGMSKAMVAADAMRKIRPNVDIRPIHGNVLDCNVLSLNMIRSFDCVINALDNIMARSHVNRLCIAANVPLIETGSAGYLGQASFISKGLTECFDCTPRKDDRNRTYPACTIRNTPSEPAHCVIWAKYLFSQLFGDADPEAEVSPDPDDPELGKSGKANEIKINTRNWAEEIGYNPEALLKKLFHEDITYLLRLDSLWKKRIPPVPLNISPADIESNSHAVGLTDVQQRDHEIWSQERCIATFAKSVQLLRERMVKEGSLSFDKDDDLAIDFVTSAANLRCTVFHISNLKRFSAKSIAGNIIAAIATTNSVIAGCAVVMAVLNVLSSKSQVNPTCGLYGNVQQLLLRRNPVPTGRAKLLRNTNIVIGSVASPNPACYVCSPSSKNATLLEIAFDFTDKGATLKTIRERLLLNKLHLATPELVTSEGRMLISADEDDSDDATLNRTLCDMGISMTGGCIALAEDMSQNISVSLSFSHIAGVSFDDALDNFQTAPCPVAKKSSPTQPAVTVVARKRRLDSSDVQDDLPSAKKGAFTLSNGNGHASNGNGVVHVIDDDNDVCGVAGKHTNGNGVTKTVPPGETIDDDDDDDCVLVL